MFGGQRMDHIKGDRRSHGEDAGQGASIRSYDRNNLVLAVRFEVSRVDASRNNFAKFGSGQTLRLALVSGSQDGTHETFRDWFNLRSVRFTTRLLGGFDRCLEVVQIVTAFGAERQMQLERHPLPQWQLAVEIVRQKVNEFLAGHGRAPPNNGSSNVRSA